MRSFEKISFEQFKNDVCGDKLIYNKFKLPNSYNETNVLI